MKRLAGLIAAAAFAVACGQTDAGITTAVKSKLAADDTVKAYQVDVDTQNKVVTLSGEVETSAQREHAVALARNTKGVADVVDRLEVNPTEATSGVTIDDSFEADVKKGADATADAAKRGADATADAAKRGAEKTKEGTKKVGEEIKDVFTDDDRDSDKDGK